MQYSIVVSVVFLICPLFDLLSFLFEDLLDLQTSTFVSFKCEQLLNQRHNP